MTNNKTRSGVKVVAFVFGLLFLLVGAVMYINSADAGTLTVIVIAFAAALLIYAQMCIWDERAGFNYPERELLKKALLYLVLTFGSVIMLMPFFWMFTSAFKTNVEINRFPPTWWPKSFDLKNFVTAFGKAPFAKYFLNSIIVMLCSVACTGITTILGAFAFSRLKFPGRELIFSLMLSLMMIPFEMLIITNYTTVVKLDLYNTIDALILPFTSSIFYTYILRNFFKSVPDSLYYSARIDGASNWTYLWKVLVPMARPSLVTIMLLNGLASWNSFMWPMYVISNETNRTLPWGLQVFTTEAGSYPGQLMAASTVVVLPVIILFLFARKYIVKGVARGGLKG